MPSRRTFLQATGIAAIVAPCAELRRFAPLAAAAERTTVATGGARENPHIADLVHVIRATPREQIVATFVKQVHGGLSYLDFLTTVFLAAIEQGDPHQVAQVFAAHRIGSEARLQERMLPLFWALDRVKRGLDEQPPAPSAPASPLRSASRAREALTEAFENADGETAERAALSVAQGEGMRHAMLTLLAASSRNTSGTLGHHPIIAANGWRTLETMGWRHGEPLLRYAARYLGGFEPDGAYQSNLERAHRALPRLPQNWAGDGHNRRASLDLYELLRDGRRDEACELACHQLVENRIQAAACWDAIHLTAADLICRYKTGGMPLGGALIHATTATNALRHNFDVVAEPRARLMMLLQALAALCDVFIAPAKRDDQLRGGNLLELAARASRGSRAGDLDEVFARLPFKDASYVQERDAERAASDEACCEAFIAVRDAAGARAFEQSARTLLCRKATQDPHDMKFPAAIFEDAARVAPQWRAHLLSASVHALHGTASRDAPALVEVRAALG